MILLSQNFFLDIFGNPWVCYILLMLGIYFLLYGLSVQKKEIIGVAGGCLGFSIIGIIIIGNNFPSIILIISGVILFIIEVEVEDIPEKIPTIAGIGCVIFGGIFFLKFLSAPMAPQDFILIWIILLNFTIVLSVIFGWITLRSIEMAPPKFSPWPGEIGLTQSEIKPEGNVYIRGEIWAAKCIEGHCPISKDQKVKIMRIEEEHLIVKPVKDAELSPFGVLTDRNPKIEEIETIVPMGARWLRLNYAAWAIVERKKGVYSFDPGTDGIVERWKEEGIHILNLISYGNKHYTGSDNVMVAPVGEEQIEGYTNFVRAIINHYKHWTKCWEIWNEPNISLFWKPHREPAAYCALLKAAYKTAKETDPECTVVGCSLSRIDLSFLERMLKLGAGRYMDVVSIHPYRPRFKKSCESSGYLEEIYALRNLMSRYGVKIPIWITEMGWTTSKHHSARPVTQEVQAAYLVRMYVLSIVAGIERIIWYKHSDINQFGLMLEDFTPKPSYNAYKTMTRLLANTICEGLKKTYGGAYIVKFRKLDQNIWVCWIPKGLEDIKINGRKIERWDLFGKSTKSEKGPITITLGSSPIYVVGNDLSHL